jgi:acetyl-CoA carboxylase carboxyl transferase subunit beta
MNWITRWKKIGIKVKQIFKKQPLSQEDTDWKSCPKCNKITYKPDLFSNSYICECSFHHDMPPKMRLDALFDSTYEIIEAPSIDPDPLSFEVKGGAREGYKYIDKIKKYREITKQDTALLCGSGTISGLSAVVVCFNRKFGAGRFGPAENEHFLKAARFAIDTKVSIWIVVYQSSGIDVHTGVMGLAGMTKSVIALDEIKKAGIPTFAIAGAPGPLAGGTYASSYYQHDFLIIESRDVENILFSGKRVTANILKGTDSIPINFGTQSGVMEAGLADITLESRKELKETVTKLANIILKKEELKTSNEETIENRESDIKVSSAS